MLAQVPLFPESASTVSDRVDALYFFLVAVAVFFTLLICVLILAFGIHYRRGSKAKRKNPPESHLLEFGWAVIPLILTMVMFVWSAVIFSDMKSAPDDAINIDVVAKQWMWKVYHPNGRSEINQLHVPVGRPVKLRMISEDVIHSFYVPSFRVKQDVLPGYYTSLWFEATKTGDFHLFCAEYCGTEHAQMRGTVVVMEQSEYADWLAGETGESDVAAGRRLFERYRCDTCHQTDGRGSGPSLVGVFGQTVSLESGQSVKADEQYLRNSIRNPAEQVVKGYRPVMPAYRPNQISEAEILKIIAYLRSLSLDDREDDSASETSNP